ncbi:heterokaryon incompatibility protein-domain-containing protein [Halenospora varia]|nr:heterokaryon incompatibility protein-domain-containing protein [Halenospora varia]
MGRWLDDCKVNHPRCQPSGPPSSLPSRLIDIGCSNSNINLIEITKTTNVEYLSLSHCWGKRQIITTTHATLNERKRNIRWGLLSKTFQDSITTTRRLGYQYIWIDSLCIIQDDKADWEIESAKMADIYENSVLTLSANTAEDGDGGCFANRYQLEKDGTRYEVESTELKYDNVDGRPLSVFKMPLFDRAWTFQERMLARRVLHFNNRELVWECDTMKKILTTEYAKSSTWSKMPLQQQQIDQWRSLALKYGGKALTYGSDKLPALSGVAKRAKIQGKGKYLAGIWEVELPEGLIWDLCTPLSSRAAVDPNIQRATYRAPTWSWASIEGSAYVVHEEGVDYKYHTKVLEADCTPKGLDPTGEVMDGHIILSAPFTQITIDLKKDLNGVHIGGTGYHYQSFALDGHQTWVLFQDHHDPANLLTQDEAAMRFVEPYKPLFCVKIRTRELDPPRAEIKRYFVTDSLLLKRSERVEGAYERLGVAKFQAADEWDAFGNAEMVAMRIV